MALTPEEKKEWQTVIDRTRGNRESAVNERRIPEEYRSYLEQVDRAGIIVPVPSVQVPVKCYISTAKDKMDSCPVYINMHGGGFVIPQDGDDDLFCAHVASKIQGIVVDIDYATSLKHPFPVAFEQCYEVVRWVFTRCEKWGADPKRISIGGHSAGGCLTAAISLRAAATKDFELCLQVLDYSALDNYKSVLEGGSERSRAFSMLYADGDIRVLKSPYCSPVFATDDMLVNQPRTLIINCGACPFKEDNEEYGMRMAAMGSEVAIKCFMNSPHGATIRMAGEWQEAQELIIRTIKEASL